jgi:hypothetical protein
MKRTLILTAVGLALVAGAACSADEASTSASETTTTVATVTDTTVAEDPEITNARRSAESYLEMTGFSRIGLIKQLEFEDYPTAAATTAVDSLDVDWSEEAVQAAESYLDSMGFSHQGLVEQLEFEGFTPEEAEHGASTALA